MMHDIMEDYVDDIFSKSIIKDIDINILVVIFDKLEPYKVKLNPKKYVFGGTQKNLGCIIFHCGKEVNLENVKTYGDVSSQEY